MDFSEAVAAGAVDFDEEDYGEVIGRGVSQLAELVSTEGRPRASSTAKSSLSLLLSLDSAALSAC